MSDKPECPTCHSLINTASLYSKQGEIEPGEDTQITDPFTGELKNVKTSTSGAIPQWTFDPLLTENSFNGPGYEGRMRFIKEMIQELQYARIAEEDIAGLTDDQKTAFTSLESINFRDRELFYVELRQSTEKILNASGSTLREYFSTDLDGEPKNPGPNDVTDKEEWSFVQRGKAYLAGDGQRYTTFILPDGTVEDSPSLPSRTRPWAILLEDLRHPLQLGWKEFWSVSPLKTWVNIPKTHIGQGIAIIPVVTPFDGHDVHPSDGGSKWKVTSDDTTINDGEKSWFPSVMPWYTNFGYEDLFLGITKIETIPCTDPDVLLINSKANTLSVNSVSVSTPCEPVPGGTLFHICDSLMTLFHMWKYNGHDIVYPLPFQSSQGRSIVGGRNIKVTCKNRFRFKIKFEHTHSYEYNPAYWSYADAPLRLDLLLFNPKNTIPFESYYELEIMFADILPSNLFTVAGREGASYSFLTNIPGILYYTYPVLVYYGPSYRTGLNVHQILTYDINLLVDDVLDTFYKNLAPSVPTDWKRHYVKHILPDGSENPAGTPVEFLTTSFYISTIARGVIQSASASLDVELNALRITNKKD